MTTCFVDTNVLVYAKDTSAPTKMRQANQWMAALGEANAAVLSAQVLREYYAVMLRRDRGEEMAARIRADVRQLSALAHDELQADYIEAAWRLQDRFTLSFWDALLIASAQAVSCSYFISEDLQDRQRFDDITVVNPFGASPAAILGAV